MSMLPATLPAVEEAYHAYGAVARLFRAAASGTPPGEIVVKGPAGTGKSRGCLEFVNWVATEWSPVRALMLRKTRRSLTESGMVTFEQKVLNPAQGVKWQASMQRYVYPNGSILAVAGMDKPGKVMSSEWDLIYVQEANELSEAEWEACTTRLRNGVAPFQLMLADRNPDAPHHWLRLRELAGRATMFYSRHEDNPVLWDRAHASYTPAGAAYLAKLDELTGVRWKRLRKGIDAAAEGTVYEDAWDSTRNVVRRDRYSRAPGKLTGDCGLDPTWPRYLGIDWGYRAPMVVKWYAKLPDGELLVYREIYATMRTVEQVARDALGYMGWQVNEQGVLMPTRDDCDPLPREIICDHGRAERETWERCFGLGTFPADKGKESITDGIQAVATRLRQGRLLYLENSLVERDPLLADAKKPCSSVEEFDVYVWDTRAGRKPKEEPMDGNDHGMDTDRYVCRYFARDEPTGGSIEFSATGY